MERDLHVRHLEMMYDSLPSDYESQEINHLTLAYFVISGLDILNALDSIDKEQVISWVLSFQVQPTNEDYNRGKFYGFYGSRSIQFSSDDTTYMHHSGGHLASTYCALAMLKILGYDLSCLDSELILVSMKTLQQHDGSFMPTDTGAEMDLRFIYCAAAICFMLNNWSGMDREKAKEYILRCQVLYSVLVFKRFLLWSYSFQMRHVMLTYLLAFFFLVQSYDGGFGLVPGSESHGGGTYCAVSALYMMGFIEDDILSRSTSSSTINVSLLLEWCLQRQAVDGGFQGRSNKASDTCYAFWVGGVLRILGAQTLIDKKALREFLLTCQTKYGGFSKFPGQLPDLYHSYYGFSAFSLLEEPGLKPLCFALGIADIASVAH